MLFLFEFFLEIRVIIFLDRYFFFVLFLFVIILFEKVIVEYIKNIINIRIFFIILFLYIKIKKIEG